MSGTIEPLSQSRTFSLECTVIEWKYIGLHAHWLHYVEVLVCSWCKNRNSLLGTSSLSSTRIKVIVWNIGECTTSASNVQYTSGNRSTFFEFKMCMTYIKYLSFLIRFCSAHQWVPSSNRTICICLFFFSSRFCSQLWMNLDSNVTFLCGSLLGATHTSRTNRLTMKQHFFLQNFNFCFSSTTI